MAVFLLLGEIPLKKGAYIEYDRFKESDPSLHEKVQLYCKGRDNVKTDSNTQKAWHVVEFCEKQIQREFWITPNREVLRSELIGFITQNGTQENSLEGLPLELRSVAESIKKRS